MTGTSAPALPAFDDVVAAQARVEAHLRPTALFEAPALSALVGARISVKHENHQPVGAFKVRGGVNLAGALADEEDGAGLMCASAGNHGLSIAYAAARLGRPATVFVPRDPNPAKVAAIRALGAEVIEDGRDFDEARERCERAAAAAGARYVHAGNEPLLIAGVGTQAVEILGAPDDIDTIIVPVGSGSGAAGACLAMRALRPDGQVIAVQSSAAPAAHRSWRARRLLEDRMDTFAEGVATRVACALPQRILWRDLDDFVLVDDDEIRRAMVLMLDATRNLVEAAGAAPLAAALKLSGRLAGRNVALVASGGNATVAQLRELLSRSTSP